VAADLKICRAPCRNLECCSSAEKKVAPRQFQSGDKLPHSKCYRFRLAREPIIMNN